MKKNWTKTMTVMLWTDIALVLVLAWVFGFAVSMAWLAGSFFSAVYGTMYHIAVKTGEIPDATDRINQ